MNRKKETPFLDALFNVDSSQPSLLDELFSPPPTRQERKAMSKSNKRPFSRPIEECPNCGSAMAAGGTCPGCGLHDEEMNWECG